MSEELPIETTAMEAYGRRKSDEPPLFLDVREPSELETAHLDPDLHIPMDQVGENWESLPSDQPIIVYCHHGQRSLHVAAFLRGKGLDLVQSMAGGIDKWSREIDPSVPRY